MRALRSQLFLTLFLAASVAASPLMVGPRAQETPQTLPSVGETPAAGETSVPRSSDTPQPPDQSIQAPVTPLDATTGQPAATPATGQPASEGAADAAGGTSATEAQAPAEDASEATELPGGLDVGPDGGAIGTLPHDLSPWGMFMAADIVVQAVIVGLVIASIVTWTVWLAKTIELWTAKLRTRRALAALEAEPSLADAARRLGKRRGVVPALVDAALIELRASDGLVDKAALKERVASRLEGIQIAAARQINVGTGLLATIGATAPFVGLFGTVWGIMNSFIGISKTQTTNLAVVAPGIAEALLATALGLVAAIPAVIIYNHFARSIGGYRALVGDAAAEVMRQLSRELDTGTAGRKRPIARAAE